MSSKISVIMSVYNTAQYLSHAIESVMAQTMKEWELIVVDDGSTDGSSQICDQMALRDNRIKVIHKENSGQADSRNQALAIARGEYVTFIDSDDWIEATMCEKLYDYIQKCQADIAVCSYREEYTNNSIIKHNTRTGCFKHDDLYRIYYFCENPTAFVIWGMLIRKELLTPIPIMRYNEDTVAILQWIDKVRQAVITDDAFYHYRMRKSSLMHINTQKERAMVNLQSNHNRSNSARIRNLLYKHEIDTYEASSYLHVALHFVRNSSSWSDRKEIAIEASKFLQEMVPMDLKDVKPRVIKRIELLRKHPLFFAWKMYLTGFFSFHERQQRKIPTNLFQ